MISRDLNPCALVRETTSRVAASARHVRIDEEKLLALAADIERNVGEKRGEAVAWDEEGLHYNDDAGACGPLTAQFLFVVDSVNFCFWPSADGFEYDDLVTALKRVFVADTGAFSAERLSGLDETELRSWFPDFDLPQLAQRARCLRMLGQVLAERFDGLAMNMVREAKQSAVRLVRLVVESVPAFRDEQLYRGEQVFLYKRAQILVADLWGAYGRIRSGGGQEAHPLRFDDIDELTMFADYRVPQILKHLGVIAYADDLGARILAQTPLSSGSEEEVEIRAVTVQVVERLRHALRGKGLDILSVEVDWYLWGLGERQRLAIEPHHRVLSIFY